MGGKFFWRYRDLRRFDGYGLDRSHPFHAEYRSPLPSKSGIPFRIVSWSRIGLRCFRIHRSSTPRFQALVHRIITGPGQRICSAQSVVLCSGGLRRRSGRSSSRASELNSSFCRQATAIEKAERSQPPDRMMGLCTLSVRLLEWLLKDEGKTGRELLELIAGEIHHPLPEVVIRGGLEILCQLKRRDVILGDRTP
jgi:hypothetical protein